MTSAADKSIDVFFLILNFLNRYEKVVQLNIFTLIRQKINIFEYICTQNDRQLTKFEWPQILHCNKYAVHEFFIHLCWHIFLIEK